MRVCGGPGELPGDDIVAQGQVDEPGPGDLHRAAQVGEVRDGQHGLGDVTGVSPQGLREGERPVRLGVGVIRTADDRIHLGAGDGRERGRQAGMEEAQGIGHGVGIRSAS